jgi:hypothetical protein
MCSRGHASYEAVRAVFGFQKEDYEWVSQGPRGRKGLNAAQLVTVFSDSNVRIIVDGSQASGAFGPALYYHGQTLADLGKVLSGGEINAAHLCSPVWR